MHTAQGGAAAETQRCSGGGSAALRQRLAGQGEVRGAERRGAKALLSARGARREALLSASARLGQPLSERFRRDLLSRALGWASLPRLALPGSARASSCCVPLGLWPRAAPRCNGLQAPRAVALLAPLLSVLNSVFLCTSTTS